MNNFAKMLPIGIVVACLMLAGLSPALAADWRQQHPEITMGVITEENAEDRAKRWTPTRDYLSKELGVPVKWREATDYAGIIEALKAKKVELAWFGPASFARAWIVTDGKAVPLAAEIDKDGGFGYFGVIIVKKDSPYKSIDDLKGKRFGFADPNSTSGYQAPNFFLTEQGYKPEEFFGKTAFSGSHENSVKMLMEGNFDAVAHAWQTFDYVPDTGPIDEAERLLARTGLAALDTYPNEAEAADGELAGMEAGLLPPVVEDALALAWRSLAVWLAVIGAGSLVAVDGSSTYLPADSYRIEPLASWRRARCSTSSRIASA